MVEEGLVDGNACGETADEGYEGFAVAFAGCGETKHAEMIIKSCASPARVLRGRRELHDLTHSAASSGM
jgi:hypothetical protein